MGVTFCLQRDGKMLKVGMYGDFCLISRGVRKVKIEIGVTFYLHPVL